MMHIDQVELELNDTPILRGVSLSLQADQVTVILGPNGAGKSSLLKVASGELQPSHGQIQFNGQTLKSLPAAEKALHMAVLPQHSSLTFPFTAHEVVALGRTPHSTGNRVDAVLVEQAMQMTDCWYLREQLYPNLSGGEKQRVQMARVLVQVWEPVDSGDRLIVLDEPTSALDYAHQQMVANLLQERAQAGCSVLTAMHDLNLAAQCADQVVLMCCGEVRAAGTADEVLQEDILREVFQVNFHRVKHPVTGKPWLIN